MSWFSKRTVVGVAAGLWVCGTSVAGAALITFDLRVADGSKYVMLPSGQAGSVTLDLYAVWALAAGENSYRSAYFGATSVEAADGPLGNLSTMAYNPLTLSSYSTGGTLMNNDGNLGDLELGNRTSGTTTAQFAYLSAGTTYAPAVDNELLLGTMTWSVTAAHSVASGWTDINVFIRPKDAGVTGTTAFKANGVTISGIASTDTRQAIGTPVHIMTPEPGSLGLFGIAAAGLLKRRRK